MFTRPDNTYNDIREKSLMQWLDEVAGVVAMRHAETYRVVTAAVDNLQFKHAIYEGEIVVLKGYVTDVGRTSMEVEIDTYVEQPDGMRRTVTVSYTHLTLPTILRV